MLSLIRSLFVRDKPDLQREIDALRECVTRETPEQTRRFYLEVAAAMGNESAAKLLRDLPDETKH